MRSHVLLLLTSISISTSLVLGQNGNPGNQGGAQSQPPAAPPPDAQAQQCNHQQDPTGQCQQNGGGGSSLFKGGTGPGGMPIGEAIGIGAASIFGATGLIGGAIGTAVHLSNRHKPRPSTESIPLSAISSTQSSFSAPPTGHVHHTSSYTSGAEPMTHRPNDGDDPTPAYGEGNLIHGHTSVDDRNHRFASVARPSTPQEPSPSTEPPAPQYGSWHTTPGDGHMAGVQNPPPPHINQPAVQPARKSPEDIAKAFIKSMQKPTSLKEAAQRLKQKPPPLYQPSPAEHPSSTGTVQPPPQSMVTQTSLERFSSPHLQPGQRSPALRPPGTPPNAGADGVQRTDFAYPNPLAARRSNALTPPTASSAPQQAPTTTARTSASGSTVVRDFGAGTQQPASTSAPRATSAPPPHVSSTTRPRVEMHPIR